MASNLRLNQSLHGSPDGSIGKDEISLAGKTRAGQIAQTNHAVRLRPAERLAAEGRIDSNRIGLSKKGHAMHLDPDWTSLYQIMRIGSPHRTTE